MFELSHYLIDPSIAGLMVTVGGMALVLVFLIFITSENTSVSSALVSALFAVPVLCSIAIIPGAGIYSFKNPDVTVLDNPISYVEESSREKLRLNEEEFYERISTELEADNISLQEQSSQTIMRLLKEGKGLNFTAVQESKAINGVVHFTEESMVITVFGKSDETIIIPTND